MPNQTPRIGEPLCDCYACGKGVVVFRSAAGSGWDGLGHEPLHEVLGPNGETGCAVFDALDGPNDFAEYVADCRKALERSKTT